MEDQNLARYLELNARIVNLEERIIRLENGVKKDNL